MTLPKARTRNVDGRRHYVAQLDGVEYLIPSASTLVSQLDKPAIAGWMVNTHLDKAHELARKARGLDAQEWRSVIRGAVRRDGNPAAESGSRVHEVMQAVFEGVEPPDYDETPWAVDRAREIADEFQLEALDLEEGFGIEATVARVEDGVPIWAGTADFLGSWVVDDEVVRGCVDWKSGASGLWPESILSTSVYTAATHWVGEGSILHPFTTPLTAGALVWVRPEGFAFCPISEEETAEAIEVLRSLAIVQRWRMLAKVSDPVNSDPIYKS